MNNTALGAESIIFISEAHEKFYYRLQWDLLQGSLYFPLQA